MIALADLTGANGTQALSATGIRASVILITATGTGTCRLGHGATSSTGAVLMGGDSYQYPYRDRFCGYDLHYEEIYIPSGVTVSVSYMP